jgi:opacity protein-like surface antigen
MRTFVLSMALLLVVTFTASAQVAFGVHGNLVNFKVSDELKQIAGLPQGNPETVALEDVYGMGYGGGVHLDFSLGILSLRLSGDYVTLTPDNEKFQTFLAQYVGAASTSFKVDGGRIEIMGGNLNLKFVVLPLPVVKPYITGGIGISQVKANETKVTYTPPAPLSPITTNVTLIDKQTPWTLNGGVGVDLVFGGLSLYVEVKVTAFYLEGGTSTYLPISSLGLTF